MRLDHQWPLLQEVSVRCQAGLNDPLRRYLPYKVLRVTCVQSTAQSKLLGSEQV